MEGGVQARHSRDTREQLARGGYTRQCCREVQWCEIRDGDQVADDLAVDADGRAQARSSVDHAMPDGLDPVQLVDRNGEPRLVEPALGSFELTIRENGVVLVDQADLEGARTSVEDQDAQAASQARSS